MSAFAGAVAGGIGLCLLDVAVSSPAAAKRAGGIVGLVAKFIRWVVDPTVAAIPNLHPPSGPTAQQKIDRSAVGHAAAGYPYPDVPNGTPPTPGHPGVSGAGIPIADA